MNRVFETLIVLVVVSTTYVACETNRTNPPKTVINLAGYSLALDECRELGKDAGSYDVYEECASKADTKFGKVSK